MQRAKLYLSLMEIVEFECPCISFGDPIFNLIKIFFQHPEIHPRLCPSPDFNLKYRLVLVRSPVDLIVPFSTHIYLAYEYVQVRKAVKSYT